MLNVTRAKLSTIDIVVALHVKSDKMAELRRETFTA